jgi:hypothetical protein
MEKSLKDNKKKFSKKLRMIEKIDDIDCIRDY